MQQQGYISFDNQQLHYIQFGEGRQLLLAFHGYANDAFLFHKFEFLLGTEYSIISVNLPFHGKSEWQENLVFSKKQLLSLLTTILQQWNTDRISLCGYSLGGRVCLNIIELLPENISRVLLIAPDGLELSRFYFFVTRTWIGKKMFSKFLKGSLKYNAIIHWFYKKKWLDASRHKFLMHYLDKEESRRFILKVWPAMRFLLPDIKKVKESIQRYKIPVDIFMGAYDRVIPVKQAVKFKKNIPEVQLYILDKGHSLFDNATLAQIAKCLV